MRATHTADSVVRIDVVPGMTTLAVSPVVGNPTSYWKGVSNIGKFM